MSCDPVNLYTVGLYANPLRILDFLVHFGKMLALKGHSVRLLIPSGHESRINTDFPLGVDLWFNIHPEDLAGIKGVDIFFTLDTEDVVLPEESIVVRIPHGLNLIDPENPDPFAHAYHFRNIPWADYTLVAQKNIEQFTSSALSPYYTDRFPAEMICRKSGNHILIPAGYLKLDVSMRHHCSNNKVITPQILYAPTPLQKDTARFKEDGVKILQALLDAFQDYVIVFRPFPGDREHPVVRRTHTMMNKNPRYRLDTSASSKDVFFDTEILITDVSLTANTFSLGTLRPHVTCDFGKFLSDSGQSARSHGFGFEVYTVEQMVEAVKKIIARPELFTRKILEHRLSYLCHPGTTSAYLCEILPIIASGSARDGWKVLPRHSGEVSLPASLDAYCRYIEKCLVFDQLDVATKIIAQGIDLFPYEPFFPAASAYVFFQTGQNRLAVKSLKESFALSGKAMKTKKIHYPMDASQGLRLLESVYPWRGRFEKLRLLMGAGDSLRQILIKKLKALCELTEVDKIVLYGASETGKRIYQYIRDQQFSVQVVGVADGNSKKWGTPFYNFTILNPDDIASLTPDAVVIASFNAADAIKKRIETLSLKPHVLIYDLRGADR